MAAVPLEVLRGVRVPDKGPALLLYLERNAKKFAPFVKSICWTTSSWSHELAEILLPGATDATILLRGNINISFPHLSVSILKKLKLVGWTSVRKLSIESVTFRTLESLSLDCPGDIQTLAEFANHVPKLLKLTVRGGLSSKSLALVALGKISRAAKLLNRISLRGCSPFSSWAVGSLCDSLELAEMLDVIREQFSFSTRGILINGFTLWEDLNRYREDRFRVSLYDCLPLVSQVGESAVDDCACLQIWRSLKGIAPEYVVPDHLAECLQRARAIFSRASLTTTLHAGVAVSIRARLAALSALAAQALIWDWKWLNKRSVEAVEPTLNPIAREVKLFVLGTTCMGTCEPSLILDELLPAFDRNRRRKPGFPKLRNANVYRCLATLLWAMDDEMWRVHRVAYLLSKEQKLLARLTPWRLSRLFRCPEVDIRSLCSQISVADKAASVAVTCYHLNESRASGGAWDHFLSKAEAHNLLEMLFRWHPTGLHLRYQGAFLSNNLSFLPFEPLPVLCFRMFVNAAAEILPALRKFVLSTAQIRQLRVLLDRNALDFDHGDDFQMHPAELGAFYVWTHSILGSVERDLPLEKIKEVFCIFPNIPEETKQILRTPVDADCEASELSQQQLQRAQRREMVRAALLDIDSSVLDKK